MMPYQDIQIQVIDTPPLNDVYTESGLFDLLRRVDLVLVVVDLQADPVGQLEAAINLLGAHRIYPLYKKREGKSGTWVPMLVVANKCDDQACDELLDVFLSLLEEPWPLVAVSAQTGRHLDRLKERIFEGLDIVRVYSKVPGKEPDLEAPFVLKRGSTVMDMAAKVHHDFYKMLKSARVWGTQVVAGQLVSRDYVLNDGDIVELHI
jgi:ribosome-interacting GTPase 1